MKRIIFALIAVMTFFSLTEAKNRTVTENDSLGNKKRVIELSDTVINGEVVTDTLSVSEDEDSDNYSRHHNWDLFDGNFDNEKAAATIIAVTAIVFGVGLPLVIIFIVFFFNYKSRKAKYRLAEQALASGQPLPVDFFKKMNNEDIRSKGFKNIFLGIGLFIFLWAMTNFSIGCIGLLIMFMGFGQVVVYYTQENNNPPRHNEETEEK